MIDSKLKSNLFLTSTCLFVLIFLNLVVMRNKTEVIAKEPSTGVMAASEIPPQMANFHTFFFFLSGLFLDTLHTAILC